MMSGRFKKGANNTTKTVTKAHQYMNPYIGHRRINKLLGSNLSYTYKQVITTMLNGSQALVANAM